MILDRDGTLIDIVRDEETGAIVTAFHPDQLRLLPGVVEGLRAAHAAGFVLAIATNQPGPAKGQASRAALERTHRALTEIFAREGVPIAAIEMCNHHPEGGPGGDSSLVGPCACRKPRPGMIETLVAKLDLDRSRTWIVGDTAADVEAGRAARVSTGLVFAAGRCELCPLRGGPAVVPDVHAASFDRVIDAILARR
jgi:D-glycero-D-manno-heptose 1,7-bisphosphate phosphatase